MALPTIKSRVAFGSTPDVAVPAYSDVSESLLAFQSRRGRNFERGQVDAGTAAVTYLNGDRRFDPTFTAGPFYPDVLPMVKTQHLATWASVDYYLHTGYVERWPIRWDTPTSGTVAPTAVDAQAALAAAALTGTFPQEKTGARITRVLEAIAWPTSVPASGTGYWALDTSTLGGTAKLGYDIPLTVIDTGLETVQAVTIPDSSPVSALTHIQEIADAEPGVFFFDGQGRAIFHDRHRRFSAVTAATFSDRPTGSEIQYEDLTPEYDVSKVVNDVTATTTISAATVTATASDETSRQQYLRRSATISPPVTTAATLADRANFEVYLFKQPQLRFERIVLRPDGQQTAWPTILGLDIGSKVVVKRTPSNRAIGDETITKTCFVEAVQHAVTKTDWTVTLQLSPGEYYATAFTLDTSTLDSSTVLVY